MKPEILGVALTLCSGLVWMLALMYKIGSGVATIQTTLKQFTEQNHTDHERLERDMVALSNRVHELEMARGSRN